MDYTPGPFWIRAPLPLGPRVTDRPLFDRELGALAGELGASPFVLHAAAAAIATNTEDGLGATYEATIGVALVDADAQRSQVDDLTGATLADAGAGADQYRVGSLRYLPQPDAEIVTDFNDPPPPPGPPPEPSEDGDDRRKV